MSLSFVSFILCLFHGALIDISTSRLENYQETTQGIALSIVMFNWRHSISHRFPSCHVFLRRSWFIWYIFLIGRENYLATYGLSTSTWLDCCELMSQLTSFLSLTYCLRTMFPRGISSHVGQFLQGRNFCSFVFFLSSLNLTSWTIDIFHKFCHVLKNNLKKTLMALESPLPLNGMKHFHFLQWLPHILCASKRHVIGASIDKRTWLFNLFKQNWYSS